MYCLSEQGTKSCYEKTTIATKSENPTYYNDRRFASATNQHAEVFISANTYFVPSLTPPLSFAFRGRELVLLTIPDDCHALIGIPVTSGLSDVDLEIPSTEVEIRSKRGSCRLCDENEVSTGTRAYWIDGAFSGHTRSPFAVPSRGASCPELLTSGSALAHCDCVA